MRSLASPSGDSRKNSWLKTITFNLIRNGKAFGLRPATLIIGIRNHLLNSLSEQFAAMVVALKHIEARAGGGK
jgi:hypothetical protein